VAFTDDDLKRLKDDLHKNETRTGIRTDIRYKRTTLEALIARLEAAEVCAEGFAESCCVGDGEEIRKWRKVAGK
jgi:hypothetical protein